MRRSEQEGAGRRRWGQQPTCQAEGLEAELGAVQDDEAVRLVQPAC